MPNWCENNLRITAHDQEGEKKLKEFIERAKGTQGLLKKEPTALLLKNFVPYQENEGTCEWCVKHWGTKWDTNEVEVIYESEDEIEYAFSTAWSPPIQWLEAVVKMYPSLEFLLKYEECGACFMGVARGIEGEVVDKCLEY